MVQERDLDRRPDPDALLALAGKETRGRLWVFLGAAPGVGKTYAMLARARALKRDGVDVVVGLVETHGRAETAALIEGLEVLPRRAIEYRGQTIEEFDIDAALARRPKLIIVDELAHTNAPDSRHPKRWQDVEELLDAHIDVWTALNIQHIESLADVVSRITGVAVRETVPDTVLRDAADIVLVDITSDELIQRLKEGKVYLPETARLAQQNFFTIGNLTALRELALRRTAARVDDQMVDYLRQHAIEGPWETSERLLVCVGPDALSEAVVRTASRLATGLNASWVAVTVQQPGREETDPAKAKRVEDALRLAERLGGETERLVGQDLPAEVLQFAQRENITQIVIGRSRASLWAKLMGRSLSSAIVRRSKNIGVHVVIGGSDRDEPAARQWRWLRLSGLPVGALAAVASVAVAVGLGYGLDVWLHLPNLSMIFLTAVLFCAVQFGLRSAVVAAVLSFFAYDFFFIDPRYEFTIQEPQEFFALLIFLVVAVFTGLLAGRARDQAQNVRDNARTTQSIYELSRKLSGAAALDDILLAATIYMHRTLGARCIVMMLPEDGELNLSVAWPPIDELDPGETSAARWAFDKGEPAGWRTGTLPNVRFQFRPLVTTRGVGGVCGIEPADPNATISPERERALNLILEQTAIAIDRSLLVKDSVKTAALEENEKLRTTLLSSLSHDLRTPLASITGAVTTLRQFGETMAPAQRADLLASIEEEAARLMRFVANLLDMSRIEAGALKPKRDYVDVAEVARAAVERARKVFPGQPVTTSLARDLPLIRGDANLLEQVLFNLLDNAQKYGGGAGVVVHARRLGVDVQISVTDEGEGVKPTDLERIFEKFYQGGRSDGRKAGTGLGLSIARGLIEAMGGTIHAESPAARRRGTRIVIQLPGAAAPAAAQENA
ncbi:sensor histidine kinase KdpD [Methylocapsa sp. S129]|uniref:sensor histidine kinase n=1 Tax=Methylocapsa sp. S129 TaxID=1641869 RepID=UPI00131B2912|nr:sensor histidine kinase KdpD [Methylocapsa sp. S129]